MPAIKGDVVVDYQLPATTCRFFLPHLPAPGPDGDEVDVTIAWCETEKARTLPKQRPKAAKRMADKEEGGLHYHDLDGVTWKLTLPSARGSSQVICRVFRADRTLEDVEEEAMDEDEPGAAAVAEDGGAHVQVQAQAQSAGSGALREVGGEDTERVAGGGLEQDEEEVAAAEEGPELGGERAADVPQQLGDRQRCGSAPAAMARASAATSQVSPQGQGGKSQGEGGNPQGEGDIVIMDGPQSPSASPSDLDDADMQAVTTKGPRSPAASSSSTTPPVQRTTPAPALQALNTSAAMPPSLFGTQTAFPPPVPQFSQLALNAEAGANVSAPSPATPSTPRAQDAAAAAIAAGDSDWVDVDMADDDAPPRTPAQRSRSATPRAATPRSAAAGPSSGASARRSPPRQHRATTALTRMAQRRKASMAERLLEPFKQAVRDAMTKEAIRELKEDYLHRLQPNADGLYVRDCTTPGYKLAHALLALIEIVLRRRIGLRARLFLGWSCLDLHRTCRATTASEAAHHALTLMPCLTPMVFEEMSEIKEVARVRPDLLACNWEGLGCYGTFEDVEDGRKKRWIVVYVGEAHGESVADRSKAHKAKHSQASRAGAAGDHGRSMGCLIGQPRLYRPTEKSYESFILSVAGPVDVRASAKLLKNSFPPLESGLTLDKMGAQHCRGAQAQATYMSRSVIALQEHRWTAYYNSVDPGYDGIWPIVDCLYPRPDNWLPGNGTEPHLGFGDIPGSRADRLQKLPTVTGAQRERQIDLAIERANLRLQDTPLPSEHGDDADSLAALCGELNVRRPTEKRIDFVRFEDDVRVSPPLIEERIVGRNAQYTLVKPTTIPAHTRKAVWREMRDFKRGWPCEVVEGGKRVQLSFDLAGGDEMVLDAAVTCSGLVDGPAEFVLLPLNGHDYAVFPISASAPVAALLASFKVVIVQADTLHPAYEPNGQVVDEEWDEGLRTLAEIASTEGGLEILYSEEPEEDAIDANGMAMCLRQMGIALRVVKKRQDSSTLCAVVPGARELLEGWGTWGQEVGSPEDSAAPEGELWIELESWENGRMMVQEGDELLVRVNRSSKGLYKSVDCASRRHGTTDGIRPSGWKKLRDGEALPGFVVSSFVNMAKASYGCWEDELWGAPALE